MQKLILPLSFLCAASAHAGVIITQLDTDAEFEMTNQGTAFEAQGSIGNAATDGSPEFGLGADRDTPSDTDQFEWISGDTIDFSLEYTIATNSVTFTTPAGTLSYAASGAPVYGLAFRTAAENGTVFLDNLFVNGSDLPVGVLSTGGAPDVSYLLVLDGIGAFGDISLTGQATLTFDSMNPPSGSELAFQIIGTVPTPGAAATIGVLALGLRRRR